MFFCGCPCTFRRCVLELHPHAFCGGGSGGAPFRFYFSALLRRLPRPPRFTRVGLLLQRGGGPFVAPHLAAVRPLAFSRQTALRRSGAQPSAWVTGTGQCAEMRSRTRRCGCRPEIWGCFFASSRLTRDAGPHAPASAPASDRARCVLDVRPRVPALRAPAARAPPAVLSLSEPAAAARPNLRWSVPVGGHERRGERRAYQPHGPHPCARLPSAAVQAGCSQKRAVARVQDDDIESESRSESKSESRSESKGVEEEVEDEVCASAKPALTPCPLSAAALCCTPAPMLRPVLSARKRPGPLTRGASHLPTVVPGHKPGAIASQEAKAGQPARPPAHAHAVGRRRRRVVLPHHSLRLVSGALHCQSPPPAAGSPALTRLFPSPTLRSEEYTLAECVRCCAVLSHQALAASAAAKTAVLIPVPLTAASTFWRMRMARKCSPCVSAN